MDPKSEQKWTGEVALQPTFLKPDRLLAVVIAFLVLVESLMFVPYVGFLSKLAVTGIVAPQVVLLFGEAARGQAPSTMLVLVTAALLPFAVGILFLYLKGGAQSVQFFFGNILKTKPPPAAQFEQFKYVMQVANIPFTLLAVVVKGLTEISAIAAALSAAIVNWLPVLLLALLALAFEWSSAPLPSLLPKPAAVALGILLLAVDLAWSFAITYTVSAKVFSAPGTKHSNHQKLWRAD